MSGFLLDVNVLVALLWPAHESHGAVQRWFGRHGRQAWATCPFTEAGFVRILSNPAFSRDAVAPREALRVLSANLNHPSHRFWKDAIGYGEAVAAFEGRLAGYRQVTAAYLLGLAMHNEGKLATLDRAILSLLPADSAGGGPVEIVPS